MDVRLAVRREVDDRELSGLHARAFGASFAGPQPWSRRLSRQSLTWVCALGDADHLLGFVNVAWDGGVHAFLLDVAVDPDHRHRGVGSALVRRATAEAAAAGCEWLHVDFEPHLGPFYLKACGFRPTTAAVLRLRDATERAETAAPAASST